MAGRFEHSEFSSQQEAFNEAMMVAEAIDEPVLSGGVEVRVGGETREIIDLVAAEREEEGNGEKVSSSPSSLLSPVEVHPNIQSTFKLSPSEKLEQLRLRLNSPPSPQPWDLGDLPTEKKDKTDANEHVNPDHYSTLNSKSFATMQRSRRRPLIPQSSYYFGLPPPDSAFGTPPVGQVGVHHPREIVRVERDYASGDVVQFSPVYPLEFEGRVTPTQFQNTINEINEILISAYSVRRSFVYNFLAVVTLQLSTLFLTSHYTKEMQRLARRIEELNGELYNPVGLNIVWPRRVAFLFLEIEYY